MDLTEFLLARIDEDEDRARSSRMSVHPARSSPLLFSSARVLAECEAKRRIVERHPQVRPPGDYYCGEDGEESPCPTLRLLALPYADHPDYREEWRP